MAERITIEISLDGKDNVSQHLSKVNNELDTLQSQGAAGSQATGMISGGLDAMATAATGFIASYGLMQIGGKIAELNELGAEVNATNRVFTELAGGPEAAAAGLNQLRGATNGVVDDMTLMSGANSLLLTGLAKTTEEAAGLTEVAVKLGGAMGQGPADAIQNLNAALLNNSFERLDMLGISASAVRVRVNELKQAGMDMSEAFAQATLEQGQIAIERLGSAADVSVTAMNILSTQFQNAQQSAGSFTNSVIETGAQLLILAQIGWGGTGGIPALEERKAKQEDYNQQLAETIQLAQQYEAQISALDVTPTTNNFLVEPTTRYLMNNEELVAQFATAGEEAGNYFREAFNGTNPEMAAEARRILEAAFNTDFSLWSDSQMQSLAEEADVTFSAAATAQQELGYQARATNEALEAQARALQNQQVIMTASNTVMSNMFSELDTLQLGYNNLSASFEDGIFTASGNTFFDPDAAASVRSEAERLADEFERIKNLRETNPDLVTEEELNRAREIAMNADHMADDAERMGAAWENASLAQIGGATSGGRENEFYQGVLANIQDPAQRAALEQQYNQQSGVETANTMVTEYAQELSASLVQEFGTGRGGYLGQVVFQALEDGIMQGLEGGALQTYIENEVGFALESSGNPNGGTGISGGQSVQVQAGEGYIALSQRTGIARETLEAANNGGMLLAGQIIQVGDGTSLVAVNGTPEDLLASTLSGAAGNVMGLINGATPMNGGPIPSGSDYTYYDPATGQYSTSNQAAAQGDSALISQEEADMVSAVQDDFLTIETSMTNIAATDLTSTFTPVVDDLDSANMQLAQFSADLGTVTARDWRTRVGLSLYLDYASIPELANNPAIVEMFATVLRANPSLVTDLTE